MVHLPASEQQIVLETDRLPLRPWQVSDAVVQHELWTERDSRVPPHRRIGAGGRPTIADLEDRIRSGSRPYGLGLSGTVGHGDSLLLTKRL